MIRRPPRSTLSSSSAASDVYKRQGIWVFVGFNHISNTLVHMSYVCDVLLYSCAAVFFDRLTHIRRHAKWVHPALCRGLLAFNAIWCLWSLTILVLHYKCDMDDAHIPCLQTQRSQPQVAATLRGLVFLLLGTVLGIVFADWLRAHWPDYLRAPPSQRVLVALMMVAVAGGVLQRGIGFLVLAIPTFGSTSLHRIVLPQLRYNLLLFVVPTLVPNMGLVWALWRTQPLAVSRQALHSTRTFLRDAVEPLLPLEPSNFQLSDQLPEQAGRESAGGAPDRGAPPDGLVYASVLRRSCAVPTPGSHPHPNPTPVRVQEEMVPSTLTVKVPVQVLEHRRAAAIARLHHLRAQLYKLHRLDLQSSQSDSHGLHKIEASAYMDELEQTLRAAIEGLDRHVGVLETLMSTLSHADSAEPNNSRSSDGWADAVLMKPSSAKANPAVEACPVNLNSYSLSREDGRGWYGAITIGAPAAHCLGFGKGGTWKLEQEMAEVHANVRSSLGQDQSSGLSAGCMADGVRLERLRLEIDRRLDVCLPQAYAGAIAGTYQALGRLESREQCAVLKEHGLLLVVASLLSTMGKEIGMLQDMVSAVRAVSYTHLRAHETPEHLVCRLLLEKKKKNKIYIDTPRLPYK
eukprot:TRINITY_DN10869_c0_g1_i1.p1 TRINITY_DN10869_c0_g1~~TRINITY_DN10869_c0_g1_i1.p1  ORF type:complete len:629 (+),score=132.42 TRINITY_DN10869_c0_g1_i1:121-2007(+)